MKNFLLITLLLALFTLLLLTVSNTSDNLAKRDCDRGLKQYCKYVSTN